MYFSVIQALQILFEVLFEFQERLLDLLLFLKHDVRVLQIRRSHIGDLSEQLHVLPQLQTHEVAQSE